MDKISKQYVKNVKSFFPIIGKSEKKYLNGLEINVEDYCEETSISSLKELYEKFGTPSEVVNAYYSNVDVNYILKQISKAKLVKRLIFMLMLAILVSTLAYGAYLHSEYQTLKNEEIFFEETIIKWKN